MGFGEDFAAVAKILEVMGQRVADFVLDFGAGPPRSYATGQVR